MTTSRLVGAVTGRRGVIVDLDDTLYPRAAYLDSGFGAVAHHVEASHGVPPHEAISVLRAARETGHTGRELQVLCDRFGLDRAFVEPLRHVMRSHEPRLQLPARSAAVLRRLRGDGWRLAVLTNGLPAVQRRKVAALGLRDLVHHVVCAEEHGRTGKPEPRPFRVALERLGVESARCVCVGDDPGTDVAGARAVGLATIWLRPPGAADPRPPHADAVVNDLADVPAAIARVMGTRVSDAA